MKNDDVDKILVEHIREHWGPPDGTSSDFEAAGKRVAVRRTRNRRIRLVVASVALLLALVLVGQEPPAPETDWLAYTASERTGDLALPAEYEALVGTIYGGARP